MKKLIKEYFNIIAYTITGMIFGFSIFLLTLNLYHYKDISEKYQKQDSDKKAEENLKIKLKQINENISVFDINTYKGNEDVYSLANIKSRLEICVRKINSENLDLIISKKTLNIKDVYEMQQFYQSQISDECLVKQLYELSLKNDKLKISSLKTISPFLENSINQLIKSTDYIQKVIKNNSSYYFSSEISKNELYNQTKDSYYSILNNYVSSVNFIYDISDWYSTVVRGV